MTSNAAQYTWAGRFSEPVSDLVKRYTASVDFDRRMWRQDIRGSLAHARMLAKQGIIGAGDLADIERGMEAVTREIESGEFTWSLDLEDVHLNIEKRLTALVGDAGKRLHTGRSRNDQVATDIRLYLRDAIDDILALIKAFRSALIDLAEKEAATPASACTRPARATTRSRPTSACGCGPRSTTWSRSSGGCASASWTWPRSTRTPSCRASRTCRWPNRSPSATT